MDGVPKTFTFGDGTDDSAYGLYYEYNSGADGYWLYGYDNLEDIAGDTNYLLVDIVPDGGDLLALGVYYFDADGMEAGYFYITEVDADLVDFGSVGGRITGSIDGTWEFSDQSETIVTLEDLSFDVERLPDLLIDDPI